MLKYVELHDDPGPSISPWMIRQTVIYQKFHLKSLSSHHIFIRLSTAMQLELKNVLQKEPNPVAFVSQWENIQLLCLRTLNRDWRAYLNYLDGEVSNFVRPRYP